MHENVFKRKEIWVVDLRVLKILNTYTVVKEVNNVLLIQWEESAFIKPTFKLLMNDLSHKSLIQLL
ncbi:hypothetical protein GZ78_27255 [Endozoicomonas numazuensis]|uniref:Uncharacterized protein n=1 Tax=Endozoicomonas numazuensis TaxID=1137799 RepID=A0A081N129_9GAMM|nr:hypothetical protein GZ78_27255 [Endozoicomonas numazuensis]